MSIDRMHRLLAQFSEGFSLAVLTHGDTRTMVEDSLSAHGKLGVRECPLRPQLVFWLVICMVLMRDRSIPAVFAELIEAGRSLFPGLSRRAVTDGAFAHARERLGADAFATFFKHTSKGIDSRPWFHGLRPVAIDGFRATMPDTERNQEQFPLQKTGRGRAAWPQLRSVCLVDVKTREIANASMGTIHDGEHKLAKQLWDSLRPSDLLIEDRGFFGANDFYDLEILGKKFLCRMPKTVKPRIIQVFGHGDYLVEIVFRRPLQPGEEPDNRRGRKSTTKEEHLVLRMIEYKLKGHQGRYRLITNVFDRSITPEKFATVYHWRWDSEIAFDELKTHLMAVHHGKQPTIFRSKSPTLVKQEFWAMLSAYNLVRSLMRRAATHDGLDPLTLSFTESLHVIESTLRQVQGAQTHDLPRFYKRLIRDLIECRLDRSRRPRQFPRVIKLKMSNFKVKKPHHKESVLKIAITLPACKKKVA
jgi:hypothetical protein